MDGAPLRKLYGLFVPRLPCAMLQIKLDATPVIDPAASGGSFASYSIDSEKLAWHRQQQVPGKSPDAADTRLSCRDLGDRLENAIDLVILHLQESPAGASSQDRVENPGPDVMALAHHVLRPGGYLAIAIPNNTRGLLSGPGAGAAFLGAACTRLTDIRPRLSTYKKKLVARGFSIVDSYCLFPSLAQPLHMVSMRIAAARRFFLVHGDRTAHQHAPLERLLRRFYHWTTIERFTTDCFIVWCEK